MAKPAAPPPKFAQGDRVCIAARAVRGHCRTPWYLRGRAGEIAEVLGRYRDPERLAYHKPGLPAQVLYKVRFKQSDLWPGYSGDASDTLEADIYEPWILPEKTRRSGRTRAAAGRGATP